MFWLVTCSRFKLLCAPAPRGTAVASCPPWRCVCRAPATLLSGVDPAHPPTPHPAVHRRAAMESTNRRRPRPRLSCTPRPRPALGWFGKIVLYKRRRWYTNAITYMGAGGRGHRRSVPRRRRSRARRRAGGGAPHARRGASVSWPRFVGRSRARARRRAGRRRRRRRRGGWLGAGGFRFPGVCKPLADVSAKGPRRQVGRGAKQGMGPAGRGCDVGSDGLKAGRARAAGAERLGRCARSPHLAARARAAVQIAARR
jgi:hypothetical protein